MENQLMTGNKTKTDRRVQAFMTTPNPFRRSLRFNEGIVEKRNEAEEKRGDEEQPFPSATALCACKWGLPAFAWMFCMGVSMWWLHIGTYYYIFEMERMEHVYMVNASAVEDYGMPFLSAGLYPANISYGSLHDPVEAVRGLTEVPMKYLDIISAMLPASWFILTLMSDDVFMWTKMIICNCLMQLLKGAFSFMTVVPDSKGWGACKKRLTPEGLAGLKAIVAPPEQGFMAVFWSTLKFEVQSRLHGESLRFCADMMFAGHTYVTCLYALGLIELLRKHTRQWKPVNRRVILGFVYFIAITEQIVEIFFVVENRFHYLMDIVMALILTLLFYTNGSVVIAAKAWQFWEGRVGDLCSPGAHHVVLPQVDPPLQLKDHVAQYEGWMLIPKGTIHSDGDTWTPICCFPFCCLWGQYHIIKDDDFRGFSGKDDDFGVDHQDNHPCFASDASYSDEEFE